MSTPLLETAAGTFSTHKVLQPVFIVGAQRSGSTMLGSMLGGHPGILCLPEGQFIADLAAGQGDQPVQPARIIDQVEKHWRFKVWELDLAGARPGPDTPQTYRGAIEWLTQQYGRAVDKPDTGYWIDHQPGHVGHLARLLKVFPNARIIHIVRDARAVAASILPLDWGPNNACGAAQFWMERNAFGFAAQAGLPQSQYIWVKYEDIVSDPQTHISRLCAFLGLDFDTRTLRTDGLHLPGFTRHQHSLVGKPPDISRIDDWRHKLSDRDIRIIEYITGDMLPYLGYAKLHADNFVVSEKMKTFYFLDNQARKFLNRLKFGQRIKSVERRHDG